MTGMVIVGGGMAGARAVINLRANDYVGTITLVSEEQFLPYDRPPLSKAAITADTDPTPVLLLDESIAASLKVELRLGLAVTKLDATARIVHLADDATIPYEKLLIATGAKPRPLTCPGGELALTLRDFADALTLRQHFQRDRRIVVIGGGFIGLELAASASSRGCKVTVIEAQSRILMRGVPEPIAAIVHARHVAAGIEIRTGTGLRAVRANAVELVDGSTIPADVVIAGIGAAPETRLAEEAGLMIDNGIACDDHMRSSNPHIFAAGDCCSFPHAVYGGRRIRLEAWRSAQEQAATAAVNMLGHDKQHATIPWFWSDQHDLSLQIAGLPDMGTTLAKRAPSEGAVLYFHLAADGRLVGASGIGPGNAIARDIKLAEMMMAKHISPTIAQLEDTTIQLKSLLKG